MIHSHATTYRGRRKKDKTISTPHIGPSSKPFRELISLPLSDSFSFFLSIDYYLN